MNDVFFAALKAADALLSKNDQRIQNDNKWLQEQTIIINSQKDQSKIERVKQIHFVAMWQVMTLMSKKKPYWLCS